MQHESNGEIRQSKVTKEWVIFAPARGKRPHDFHKAAVAKAARPEHSPTCPFCPGNEGMLPGILAEMPAADGSTWQTRVVPNRYPVLTPEGTIARYQQGIYVAMRGYGNHEVIIETPLHNQHTAAMPVEAVRTLIETYHRRYLDLYEDNRNQMILVFRNHGPRAGASLEHPHSQVVAAGIVPRRIRWRNFEAQRYHDEWGRCVYCDIIEHEIGEGCRVIFENRSFLTFIPYAAEVPFETWIIPKRHHPCFSTITETEKADMAEALKFVLHQLSTRLNDPDYNYIIYSNPRYGNAPQLHWYLRVRPRLVTRAGFEIGTGMRINPSLPEADAAFLLGDV